MVLRIVIKMIIKLTKMNRKIQFYSWTLLLVVYVLSCTSPELMENEFETVYQGDTASIRQIIDPESYIRGKCLLLSFEKQDYSIPYSQLTVDTAYADADWITISKHSTYVTVTVKENHTTEYRNCYGYYRLIGNEKFDTIIISQGPKDTFFIQNNSNTDRHVLDYRKHDVYFDIFSNVEYSIEIPDSAKEWIKLITPTKTKSIFKDSRFGIAVLANDGDYRETYVSLKSKKSNECQQIRIAQDKKHHTLDAVIAENPELSIFYEALVSTGLRDTLQILYDYSYPTIEYEWTEQALRDNYGGIHYARYTYSSDPDYIAYPTDRKHKFTMFVVPNEILKNDYNIKNIDDLRDYAQSVYHDGTSYPDNNEASSLFKLIAYHILPCHLSYSQLNTSDSIIVSQHRFWAEHDIEDFYETMLPHSIMRISTPCRVDDQTKPLGIFINRKGNILLNNLTHQGIEITNPIDYRNLNLSRVSQNGEYHYVNKLILYDNDTRYGALNTRMRIMASTLSPDFINSNGRGRLNGDPNNNGLRNINKMSMAYKAGFCKNVRWVEDQSFVHVKYRDPQLVSYNGDEIVINGDIAFKLPPVPFNGNYEIRIFNNALSNMRSGRDGIIQFSIHQYNPDNDSSIIWKNWDWSPCGLPEEFRRSGDLPQIGYISDEFYYSSMSREQAEIEITISDKNMRNRGYMKGPDSYGRNGTNYGDIYYSLRANHFCYRKIITKEFLKADNNYWIRMHMENVDNNLRAFFFNFIEIVPYSVYSGEFGPEDRH